MLSRLGTGIILATLLFTSISCSKRAQCPSYMEMTGGTLSLQDEGALSPEEIRSQSQKLLDTQNSYISVKRDKKTGLVKKSMKTKKGQNYTKTHKNFKNDPRTLQGIK